jgi:hypothetical protein
MEPISLPFNDIVPDHRDPKGMGGSWRDDHPDTKLLTGGATQKKDRPGWTTDPRSVCFSLLEWSKIGLCSPYIRFVRRYLTARIFRCIFSMWSYSMWNNGQ